MLHITWLNEYLNIIQKMYNIKNHLLLSSNYGIEENILISHLTKIWLCLNNKQDICYKCINCQLFKENKNPPDLYILKITNQSDFNIKNIDDLLKFSKNIPIFGKKKIIVLLYEINNINEKFLYLINNFLKIINKSYSYIKLLIKVNVAFNYKLFLPLLKYCIHIHISQPDENMCILWLKNNLKFQYKNNIDILTALRINKYSLKKTEIFYTTLWYKYQIYINNFIIYIKNFQFCFLLQFFLETDQNIIIYLYWLIELLLDILKIMLKLPIYLITNYKYYFLLKNIFINKKYINNIKYIFIFLKDILFCYNKFIATNFINKDIIFLKLYIKWITKKNEILKLNL